MECDHCHRYYFIEGELPDSIKDSSSHTTCARCLCCDPGYKNFYKPEQYIKAIKEELDAGTVWQGEDKSKWDRKDTELYEQLYGKVMRKRDEGSVDRR